ncbi:hypothetical protein CDC45_15960 [Ralstonia pseudosolanacearum]|nr:hypothetical protein CDC45_15960 [Ralstonia pseudosolanacearum]
MSFDQGIDPAPASDFLVVPDIARLGWFAICVVSKRLVHAFTIRCCIVSMSIGGSGYLPLEIGNGLLRLLQFGTQSRIFLDDGVQLLVLCRAVECLKPLLCGGVMNLAETTRLHHRKCSSTHNRSS